MVPAIAVSSKVEFSSIDFDACEHVDASEATLIVVHDNHCLQDMVRNMPVVRRSAVPIIALSPTAGVDCVASAATLCAAVATFEPVAQQVARMPPDLLDASNPAMGLLAYLGARRKRLVPVLDPQQPKVCDFGERERFANIANMDDLITHLHRRRWLSREFVERLNVCPTCSSARLLVRDECGACTSSHIHDLVIIHHFRCAYQAPEANFRTDEGVLRCPKCWHKMEQAGYEYDVSSGYHQCLSCNETAADLQLGFRCLDCNHRGNGASLVECDVYSYGVTNAGYATIGLEAPERG